jgi:AcrR family transcriptional regulator
MGKSSRTKVEQREATTRQLIEIAREHFTRDGYANAATEEIVAQAGVTRGALYHHFGSKEGLFLAVLHQVQQEIGAQVEEAVGNLTETWDILKVGSRAFLQASLAPQVRRILLIDAPAVVGWEAWRQADAEGAFPTLQVVLAQLQSKGELQGLSIDALAYLLSGAMNEAALWIAQAEQQDTALESAVSALDALIDGLRR